MKLNLGEPHQKIIPDNVLIVFKNDVLTNIVRTPRNGVVLHTKNLSEFEEESNLRPS